MGKKKSNKELIAELRLFHHDEAADLIEKLLFALRDYQELRK